MGSITFNSLDGYSRAHSHIFGEIREIKALSQEDDDVMLSLSTGFFADYLWIAGPDRKAFAERIRSVLATAPEGEWTRRGLQDWSDPESKAFAESYAKNGMRVPGLHSLAEHLEASDEHPVVVTHSVSAHFPTTEYADKKWLREAKKLHGENYIEHFNDLPDEEQWRLTMPRLMKEEDILEWSEPLSVVAEAVRRDLQGRGLWKSAVPKSVAEKEILGAKSWDDTEIVLEGFLQKMKPIAAELLGDEPSYVICNALDCMVIAEGFAQDQGDRLPGIAHAYTQIFFPGWRTDYDAHTMNQFVEECRGRPTVFLPTSMIAVSAEIIQLIDMLGDRVTPSRVVVLAAVANAPQVRLIEQHFANHSFKVSVHSLEEVDDNLLETRKHLSEMTRDSSNVQPPMSSWFWERYIAAIKESEKARKKAKEEAVEAKRKAKELASKA
jgi:hypothetical protein